MIKKKRDNATFLLFLSAKGAFPSPSFSPAGCLSGLRPGAGGLAAGGAGCLFRGIGGVAVEDWLSAFSGTVLPGSGHSNSRRLA